jgi:hypothetical protein
MYVTVILYCIIKLERSALVTFIPFVTNDFFRWSSPQPPELCSAAYNGQKLDKWLKLIKLHKVLFWFISANVDHDAVPPVQETIHYGHFTLCFLQIQATHASLTQRRNGGLVRGAKLLIPTVIHGETLNRPAVQPVGDLWAMKFLCGGPDSPPLPSAPSLLLRR